MTLELWYRRLVATTQAPAQTDSTAPTTNNKQSNCADSGWRRRRQRADSPQTTPMNSAALRRRRRCRRLPQISLKIPRQTQRAAKREQENDAARRRNCAAQRMRNAGRERGRSNLSLSNGGRDGRIQHPPSLCRCGDVNGTREFGATYKDGQVQPSHQIESELPHAHTAMRRTGGRQCEESAEASLWWLAPPSTQRRR